MDSVLLGFLILLPLLPPLALLAVVRYGPFPNRWWRGERVWGFALGVMLATVVLGFVAGLVLWPSSNLGPAVGMAYGGPLGVGLGLMWGLLQARRGRRTAQEQPPRAPA